jgi:hypothetical protein
MAGKFRFVQQIKNIMAQILVGLKAHSTYDEKIRPGSGFYIIFEIKKWLNMISKPDNKCGRGGDII